jgi:hypothetical protein
MSQTLPTPEVVDTILYTAPELEARVIQDPSGVVWGQMYCHTHREWETHPEPFENPEEGIASLKRVQEALAPLLEMRNLLLGPPLAKGSSTMVH